MTCWGPLCKLFSASVKLTLSFPRELLPCVIKGFLKERLRMPYGNQLMAIIQKKKKIDYPVFPNEFR